MQVTEPDKLWWTTREIADAKLADLAQTQQGVDKYSKQYQWREQPDLARRRQGRGGGWEYSWELFPLRAKKFLLAQVADASASQPKPKLLRDEAWTWFDNMSDTIKQTATKRLKVSNYPAWVSA